MFIQDIVLFVDCKINIIKCYDKVEDNLLKENIFPKKIVSDKGT